MFFRGMATQRCGARNRNNPNNDNNNHGFRVALSTFVAPVPELPGGRQSAGFPDEVQP